MALKENQVNDANWQVPSFESSLFHEKKQRYALVIPVINEGDRIRGQLEKIAAARPAVDVVVADGGSTDGSLDHDFVSRLPVRAVLTKTGPGRLSAQLRMAYAWCLNEGYEGIITIDGNGKDGVEGIDLFVAALEDGIDYAQGSRYVKNGKAERTPFERTIANRMIHAPLLSLAGRYWFSDTTNGFRAYSARYLRHPAVQPFRDIFMKYELLFYLTTRAGQLGLKICQIPVSRSYPPDTATPTKINGIKGKLEVLSQTFAAAFGQFKP
jgi:glycosyltransferase involved in cell wall biosynthesis